MRIILGSKASRRLDIMRTIVPAGMTVEVLPADIDEKAIRNPNPSALTLAIARAKNEAVRSRLTGDAIIVTADTVGVCDGQVREKPVDAIQLRQFVISYNTLPVTAITSVWVHRTATGWYGSVTDHATVWFDPFTDAELDAIVKDAAFYESAGGYLIEHPLMLHRVKPVFGNRQTVLGLPGRPTQLLIEDAIGG